MNSVLAFFLSFGVSQAPAPAQDTSFLKNSAQVQSFCAKRYVFEDELKSCQEKAMFIGLEKAEACSSFSKVSVDREKCLASAGEGTSIEMLRLCGTHEFSMKKVECLEKSLNISAQASLL